LTSPEVLDFTDITFAKSSDKKKQFIATLTSRCSDGNYRSLIWLWDKARLITSFIFKVEQDSIPSKISFNPDDANFLLVIGKNFYKYLKMNQD
jgi:hypothetical protein